MIKLTEICKSIKGFLFYVEKKTGKKICSCLDAKRKVQKRKKRLIRLIQLECIRFARPQYIDQRKPLGIASEAYFREGNKAKANNYIVEFERDGYWIIFTAQIRANLIQIIRIEDRTKPSKDKEGNEIIYDVLSFIDQTLQYPEIFKGPTDVWCTASNKKLRHILAIVDNINLHNGLYWDELQEQKKLETPKTKNNYYK